MSSQGSDGISQALIWWPALPHADWRHGLRLFFNVGVRQHVTEFFRLRRLCRYPGAAGELCIFEIKRLKTHNCRITRNIDYHVTWFGDHPLSILARAFHAHRFIGSEQGTRYFVRGTAHID
jgi:hypothetical protein